MRKTMMSLVLAAAGVAGMAGSMPASAQSGRIYVDIGDVSFSYGQPYWRYNREPLYVVYERGYPRYYRYDRGWRGDRYYSRDPVVYVDYDRYDRRHRYDRRDRYDRYDRDRRYYRDRDWRYRGW